MKNITRKLKQAQNYRHKVKEVLADVRKKYNVVGRLTDADFYRICKAEKIILLNSDDARKALQLDTTGLYIFYRERSFIYLRSFFGRKLNLFVAVHELGHHFLGHLVGHKKAGKGKVLAQKEKEANCFARLFTQAEVKNAKK